MMTRRQILKGFNDYDELKKIVGETTLSFNKLAEKLNAYYYDGEVADIDFKNIRATIQTDGNKITVASSFEIWDTNFDYTIEIDE